MRNVNEYQTPNEFGKLVATGKSPLRRTAGLVQEEFSGFWFAPVDAECQRVSKLYDIDWAIQNQYRMSATGWDAGLLEDVQASVDCVFGTTPTDLKIDCINGMSSMPSTPFVADEVWIGLGDNRDYSIKRGSDVQVVTFGLASMIWHRDPGEFWFDATNDHSWHILLRMTTPS